MFIVRHCGGKAKRLFFKRIPNGNAVLRRMPIDGRSAVGYDEENRRRSASQTAFPTMDFQKTEEAAMTKEEYLAALEIALQPIRQKRRVRILEDYAQRIDRMIAAGYAPQAAVAAQGDSAEVAAAILSAQTRKKGRGGKIALCGSFRARRDGRARRGRRLDRAADVSKSPVDGLRQSARRRACGTHDPRERHSKRLRGVDGRRDSRRAFARRKDASDRDGCVRRAEPAASTTT